MNYVWISGALTGTSIALLIMLAYRFTYRVYRRRVVGTQGHPTTRTPTAIIGAGAAAAALLSDLDERTQGRYRPYCLVDDDPAKQHKRIHGVPVYGPIDDVAEILRDTPVTDIILAIRALTPERRKKILELCSETHCRIHTRQDCPRYGRRRLHRLGAVPPDRRLPARAARAARHRGKYHL